MRAIWKFAVNEMQGFVEMPAGARILHAGVQVTPGLGEGIFVWALVDPSAPMVKREIIVAGTGHRFAPGRKVDGSQIEDKDIAHAYVGTAHLAGGSPVFHVFAFGERP